MQATTALRKISALKKRIWGIQGGQGAGKTYAILQILCNHASSKPNKEIFIASEELSKMRITVIKDFVNIVQAFGIFDRSRWVDGTLYRFPNGSFIKFIGLDKVDIGKGLRCDIMFVNEANKTKFDTFRELTSRAKRVILDFNPNKRFWFHTEILTRDDCDFLKLTFQDNEFLSEQEKYEILLYKKKGYKTDNETGNYAVNEKGELVIINNYWANMWRVYGLGEIGQVEGRIYNWTPCSLQFYLSLKVTEYFACDWGKVDPWAIVGLKYYDGNLYIREYNYASENEIERNMSPDLLRSIRGAESGEGEERQDGLVAYIFTKLGIPKNAVIVCDSNRPNKIRSLRRAGWEYAIAIGGKTDLINRIGVLSGLNINYTDDSKNIEAEQENYCYDKDKNGVQLETPIDQDNHCFLGDTKITTKKGLVNINEINENDFVLTSRGFKKVLKRFNNGRNEVCDYILIFNDRKIKITCTENHKVKTSNGWVKVSQLKRGMELYNISTGKDINFTQTKNTYLEDVKECTLLFTNFLMERLKKAFMSITSMKINLTTFRQISKAKEGLTILANTCKKSIRICLEKEWITQGLVQASGTVAKMAGNGTKNSMQNMRCLKISNTIVSIVNQNTSLEKSAEKKTIDFALGNALAQAEENLELMTKKEIASFAQQNLQSTVTQKQNRAAKNALLKVEIYNKRHEYVYDLHVENCHEYFANGVLVHNCIDGASYGVQYMFAEGIIKNI